MVAPKEVIYTGGLLMLNILLMIVLSFLAVSMYIAYQKEKSRNKRIEECINFNLFLFTCNFNLFAYWFQFGGMLTVLFSIVLLLVGAYFTKYIPISKRYTEIYS